MNLVGIRNQFKVLSGRYDLVDDDVSGTANFLINEACRYLDRLTEHQKSYGVHFVEASIGQFKVDIPYCRSIKEVWATSASLSKWKLEKMDLQELVSKYLSSPPSSGTILYYSPTITRKIPEDADLTSFSSYLTYMDTSVNLDHNHNAVVFSCPTNEKVLIEVRGFFYSKELSDDNDENYWTVVHPLTLLKATMMQLEVFNQNKSKAELWNQALMVDLDMINKDLIEEDISEIDEIDG